VFVGVGEGDFLAGESVSDCMLVFVAGVSFTLVHGWEADGVCEVCAVLELLRLESESVRCRDGFSLGAVVGKVFLNEGSFFVCLVVGII